MAPTKSSKKDKRIRPKLTPAQKETRRQKFIDLTNAIGEARNSYQEAAHDIAKQHGR
jgi:hypothetical protein